MREVRVRAPAKINLWLSAGPPGSDGFHPLATVFQAVSLYDDVTVRPRDDGEFTVSVVGPFASEVPADSRNLAVRAAELLAMRSGVSLGADLVIRKEIPVAGGLAGGSTDAAAALVGCARAWGVQADLFALAAELGSDVPFCLLGHTALGHGRGDQLTEVMSRGPFHWVFAASSEGLSTPAVYAELDALRERRRILARPPAVPDSLFSALVAGDPAALGVALGNDLQEAALSLRPSLADTLRFGLENGALAGLVSGSGPTCFFLAPEAAAAADLATALDTSGLCDSVHLAEGPVPGPRPLD